MRIQSDPISSALTLLLLLIPRTILAAEWRGLCVLANVHRRVDCLAGEWVRTSKPRGCCCGPGKRYRGDWGDEGGHGRELDLTKTYFKSKISRLRKYWKWRANKERIVLGLATCATQQWGVVSGKEKFGCDGSVPLRYHSGNRSWI